MDKFFKISERGSTIKTEIMAGLTTFFAMAYIVLVNPNQVAGEGKAMAGWQGQFQTWLVSLVQYGMLYSSHLFLLQ